MSKTVNVPADWTPDKPNRRKPQWSFGSPDDGPTDDVDPESNGWRLVCRDENGEGIYAPPARYSVWFGS